MSSMPVNLFASVIIVLMTATTSCNQPERSPGEPECSPGEPGACQCPDGKLGLMECGSVPVGWGECECAGMEEQTYENPASKKDAAPETVTSDKEIIRKIISSRWSDIEACYDEALSGDSDFMLRVHVEFIIEPSGEVQEARTRFRHVSPEELEEDVVGCFLDVTKTFSFPSLNDKQEHVVTYRIVHLGDLEVQWKPPAHIEEACALIKKCLTERGLPFADDIVMCDYEDTEDRDDFLTAIEGGMIEYEDVWKCLGKAKENCTKALRCINEGHDIEECDEAKFEKRCGMEIPDTRCACDGKRYLLVCDAGYLMRFDCKRYEASCSYEGGGGDDVLCMQEDDCSDFVINWTHYGMGICCDIE